MRHTQQKFTKRIWVPGIRPWRIKKSLSQGQGSGAPHMGQPFPTSFQRGSGENSFSDGRPGLEILQPSVRHSVPRLFICRLRSLHSCATAPDLHRFRLSAFPSGGKAPENVIQMLDSIFGTRFRQAKSVMENRKALAALHHGSGRLARQTKNTHRPGLTWSVAGGEIYQQASAAPGKEER